MVPAGRAAPSASPRLLPSLEEVETGLIHDWDDAREIYDDPGQDGWRSLILPILKEMARGELSQASNRREDFRGPLILEPAHGADLGCLELLRQLF